MKCLITGCELSCPQEGWWAHGDLHEVGDCYVFNGMLEDDSMLKEYDPVPTQGKVVGIAYTSSGYNYFQSRGVVVVAKADTILNKNAQQYIANQEQRS